MSYVLSIAREEVSVMPRPFNSSRFRRIALGVVAVAAIGLAGTTLALAASHKRFVNPFTSVSWSDTTSGAVIAGLQNGTGVAVEGIAGTVNGSTGMLGFLANNATNGVGMEGLVWGPSSTGLYGQALHNTNTATPSVGLLGTSTSGIGVEGQSLVTTGIGTYGLSQDGLSTGQLGVGGASGVIGTSGRGSFLNPGVDGESTTSGIEDTGGAFGLSAYLSGHQPVHGVLGYGSGSAVLGIVTGSGASTTNAGVFGEEFGGVGASGDNNAGVLGVMTWGQGILAEGGGSSPTRTGFPFTKGLYVVGGNTGTGTTYAVGEEIEAADTNTDALYSFNNADGRYIIGLPAGNTNLLEGFGGGGSFRFDVNGNEVITGLITTAGACSGGCSPIKGHENRVVTYSAQSSEPTVEDYGEGRLVAGSGAVKIDSAFARSIDVRQGYLVFLTPEGDNRGLYVTQRSASGFMVRESQGGTATIGFMYRIVAKPFGVTAARLPVMDMSATRSPQQGLHGHAVPQTMDPYAALVKEVGPARAAQILAQARANYQQRMRMLRNLPHADKNGVLHLGSTVVSSPNN